MSALFAPQPDTQITPVALTAPVQEVFSSIQGEGPHVGVRQLFIRFAHCHLKCAYCDTPMQSPTGECFVETAPHSGKNDILPNPVSIETLYGVIQHLTSTMPHHSVSFTGGEPLLYHRYLAELFPLVQPLAKTYLETSGTQPEFLQTVLSHTDIVAMDIKLPSSTGEKERFAEHRAFYDLIKSRPETEVFIKLVFNRQSTLDEMAAVVDIVTDAKTPIILQPETKPHSADVPMDGQQMGQFQAFLSQHFESVRVIPQTHKMLQVL